MELKTIDHPEANGRKAQIGDVAWNISMPLESGEILVIHMGKKCRDNLFGMLIADCKDSGESEPEKKFCADYMNYAQYGVPLPDGHGDTCSDLCLDAKQSSDPFDVDLTTALDGIDYVKVDTPAFKDHNGVDSYVSTSFYPDIAAISTNLKKLLETRRVEHQTVKLYVYTIRRIAPGRLALRSAWRV